METQFISHAPALKLMGRSSKLKTLFAYRRRVFAYACSGIHCTLIRGRNKDRASGRGKRIEMPAFAAKLKTTLVTATAECRYTRTPLLSFSLRMFLFFGSFHATHSIETGASIQSRAENIEATKNASESINSVGWLHWFAGGGRQKKKEFFFRWTFSLSPLYGHKTGNFFVSRIVLVPVYSMRFDALIRSSLFPFASASAASFPFSVQT